VRAITGEETMVARNQNDLSQPRDYSSQFDLDTLPRLQFHDPEPDKQQSESTATATGIDQNWIVDLATCVVVVLFLFLIISFWLFLAVAFLCPYKLR
jgi:hypothetical protein